MAKRKKGSNYGKRAGERSQEISRRREQRRMLTYTLIGVAALAIVIIGITISQTRLADDSALNEGSAQASGFSQDDSILIEQTPDAVEPLFENDGSLSFALLNGERPLAELTPQERNNYYSAAPEMVIDTDKTYEAVLNTANGAMRFRLFDDQTPQTVNNFIYLANQGYYDGTTFHRVLEDFMAQAGDPTGTGTGGPGYQFADEIDSSLTFDRRGLLAMANAGPATNGSQFFITYEPTPWLNGNHTIFGELIEGDDVLSAITLRDPQRSATPGDLIESIEIYEAEG